MVQAKTVVVKTVVLAITIDKGANLLTVTRRVNSHLSSIKDITIILANTEVDSLKNHCFNLNC